MPSRFHESFVCGPWRSQSKKDPGKRTRAPLHAHCPFSEAATCSSHSCSCEDPGMLSLYRLGRYLPMVHQTSTATYPALNMEARLTSAMSALQANMPSSRSLFEEPSDLVSASSLHSNRGFSWMQLNAAGSMACHRCTGCPQWQVSVKGTDSLASASSFIPNTVLSSMRPDPAGLVAFHSCTGCPRGKVSRVYR